MEPGQKVIWDDADVAIVTGVKSGVIVVDIDDPNAKLPGPVPETFKVKTKKGWHLYFKHPDFPVPTLRGFPCEGFDLRGDKNGLAVIQGDGYEVLDEAAEPADCPEWLLQAIADYERRRAERQPVEWTPVTPDDPTFEIRREVAGLLCKLMPPAISGKDGSNATLKVARNITRGLLLAPDDVRDVFEIFNARCTPPWDSRDLDRKLDHGAATGPIEPGQLEPAAEQVLMRYLGRKRYERDVMGALWPVSAGMLRVASKAVAR